MKKQLMGGLLVLSVFLATVVAVHPGTSNANNEEDVVRAPLYRDGSISCSGADNTSKRGGQVVLFPAPGAVHFKVKLRNAQPNASYTVAVSEEPNCANAQF